MSAIKRNQPEIMLKWLKIKRPFQMKSAFDSVDFIQEFQEKQVDQKYHYFEHDVPLTE